jgi:hypothetical protein
MTCRLVFKLWHDFIHKICGQLIHKTQDWHQHARRCLKITLGKFIELDQALRPLPGPLRTILSTKSVHKAEEPGEWSGDHLPTASAQEGAGPEHAVGSVDNTVLGAVHGLQAAIQDSLRINYLVHAVQVSSHPYPQKMWTK